MTKLKLNGDFFKSSDEFIVYNFLYIFFSIVFIYIKLSQTLSSKYYQVNKGKLVKDAKKFRKKKNDKMQITIGNNFIYSLDNDEQRVMHSKSHNTEVMNVFS